MIKLTLKKAFELLRMGLPVLVHDSEFRENEVDIFILASRMTPEKVRLMRKDGGGLICVAIHPDIANALKLPYIQDIYISSNNKLLKELTQKEIPYDKRSSFSITVNHVKTITGITDIDRALTIRRIGELCKDLWFKKISEKEAYEAFIKEFRSPGHVHLLRGSDRILENRKGHTELAIALALMAGVEPCVALVEMLSDDGKALPVNDAINYAKKRNIVFLEGEEIEREFKKLFK